MPLFKYGVRCDVCGVLDTKFTCPVYALRAGVMHKRMYERVFNEVDHLCETIDLQK